MKNYILIALLYALASSFTQSQASAQGEGNLHAFLLADTDASQTGLGHSANARRMKAELDSIAKFTKLSLVKHYFEGAALKEEDVLRKLTNLPVSSRDVVVFYVSGTEYIGRYRPGAGRQVKLKEGELDLKVVENLIYEKQPRFFVMLADLCNQFTERTVEAPPMFPRIPANYQALFAEATGAIVAHNHASRDQASLYSTPTGTAFTNSFLTKLREPSTEKLNWNLMAQRTRFLTIRNSAGSQNPNIQIQETMPAPAKVVKRPALVQNTNNSEGGSNEYNYNPSRDLGRPNIDPNRIAQANREAQNGDLASTSIDRETGEEETEENDSWSSEDNAANGARAISSSMTETLRQEGSRAVSSFQDLLSQMASASSEDLIDRVMALFKDEATLMEVSSTSGRKSKRRARRYLKNLAGISGRYSVAISWYKPTEIGELQPQADGSYLTTAHVYQEFRKTNRNGNLVYGDRTQKELDLILRPNADGQTWDIKIGDVRVVEGSTQPLEQEAAAPAERPNEAPAEDQNSEAFDW